MGDVLTDEVIDRIGEEIEYRLFVDLGIGLPDHPVVRDLVVSVIKRARYRVYCFNVEIRAESQDAARRRVLEAFQLDPSRAYPLDVLIHEPAEGLLTVRIPASKAPS
jgi:hypothetical protein